MRDDDYQHGASVRDVITDFAGTAMGICQYISGCTQVLVAPKINADGNKRESEWFDIQRLERVGNEFVALDNVLVPGHDLLPPKR